MSSLTKMNNITTNITQGVVGTLSEVCNYDETYVITYNTLIAIIMVATYFGNALVLASLYKFSKHFKTRLFTYLQHLALSDLLLAVTLTIRLVSDLGYGLNTNKYLCMLRIIIGSVSILNSIILLCIISVDRFCAIMFPMKNIVKSAKKKRQVIALCFSWTVSILIGSIPAFTGHKFMHNVNSYGCNFAWFMPDRFVYSISIALPLYVLLNIILCVIIAIRLKTNSMSKAKLKSSLVKCGFIIFVYLTFGFCWTPFVTGSYVAMTTESQERNMEIKCKLQFAVLFGFLNSGMNWVIYGFANMKFRQAFKKLLTCDYKSDIVSNSNRVYYQTSRST